jgi:thioredoxin
MTIVKCPNCGTRNRLEPQVSKIPKCGKCGTTLDAGAGEADAGKPLTITDATFQSELSAAGNRPILVDAWAPWCGPCRLVGPIMEQLASEAHGRYRIAKLNVDENPQTAQRFQISSIPTLLIFKNGTLVDRMIGAQSKEAILSRLDRVA